MSIASAGRLAMLRGNKCQRNCDRQRPHGNLPRAGSISLGCDAAFRELQRSGQIEHLPRLLLAQPRVCCPLFNAFHDIRGSRPTPAIKGLAEDAAIPVPVRLNKVVEAVRRPKGTVVSVGEPEIVLATRDLAAIGLYCEPTSAVAAAGVAQLAEAGWIDDDAETVVILTGSGLKAADAMAATFCLGWNCD